MIPNLVSIVVKYIPASSLKSSRVKLTFSLCQKSKTILYSHEFNSCEDNALAFLKSKGLEPIARTCLPDSNDAALLFSFEDFDALKLALFKL